MAFPDFMDLQTQLRSILNESTAAMWSDAELKTIINDAERDIAVKTGCIENTDSSTTSAGTRTVSYNGYGVRAIDYVPSSGPPIALKRISVHQLGRVKCIGVNPQYYAVWGSNILIEPIPTATFNLLVYVADYPLTFMSSTTDEPEIQKEYHEDILLYAPYMALLKPGKFKQSQDYYRKYILSLSRKMKLVASRDNNDDKVYYVADYINRNQPIPQQGQ